MTTIEDVLVIANEDAAIGGNWLLLRAAIEQYAAERVAEARKPLTDEQVWADDGIMAANAAAGLPLPVLMLLKRAIERAHGIGEQQNG